MSEFLAEVGVLVSVFPVLDIIISKEPDRLLTVLPWSLGIAAICLIAAAAIISSIGPSIGGDP